MYYIDIEHKGLGKFRRIQGADQYVVEQRAHAQRQVWEEQWERKQEVDRARNQRTQLAILKEQKKKDAECRTEEAQKEIASVSSILQAGLSCKPGDV